jgi:hypothetical protein
MICFSFSFLPKPDHSVPLRLHFKRTDVPVSNDLHDEAKTMPTPIA